jgi:phosphomannomutase
MIANPKIFKAYDIRGEWNKDWDKEFVYDIGKAIATSLKPKIVAIGRDMRNSSPEIFEQLSKALVESGVDVKDLGLCGTELTYFASSFIDDIDLAIMITASHNPGKDNGLKITRKGSISLGLNSGLDKIRDLAISKEFSLVNDSLGHIEQIDIWEEYKNHVFKLAGIEKFPNLKIVVDVGNGIGGYMFDKVLNDLNVSKMYWQPDGTFPNHIADPFQEKNTLDLKFKVLEEKADLGIALDGDADRVFFVDSTGRYIPGYYLGAILTKFILDSNTNCEQETIVYDPRYYLASKEVAKSYSAKVQPSKVGHTLIKARMREFNSIFSAECSGHIFYRNNNFAESSMLTILLVLKLIENKEDLGKIADYYFENCPISGEINFIVDDVQRTIAKIEDKYKDGNVSKLDGIGVDYFDWRFSLRGSNTQPLIRLNVEARTRTLVDQKVAELKELIGGKIADH